jgi:hypothetical protein
MKVTTVRDTPPYGHAYTNYLFMKYGWICLNYLTLRSKVKVPRRSLWYVTHRLMVMHPHTNYHWPNSKDKNVMARKRKYYLKNNYLTLKSRSHKGHYGTWHTTLWSCTHIPIIIDLSRKIKMLWPGQENTIFKQIIWPSGQRSRSHKGHYGTRHTALWWCTHIRNIIDLSRKTKKLWSGQVSLRRSGRKNQTKAICLPSFKGET